MEIQVTPDERALIEQFMGDGFYLTKDWNGLMPVVDRILDTAAEGTKEINNEGLAIFEIGLGAHISTVYDAVTEYIKWYNEQAK